MKLRLRGNTIRLRLLEGEVARLAQGDEIRETLPTPLPFHFAVRPADVGELRASFDGQTLVVEAPREWCSGWAASDEVGRRTQGALDILIEKDWACTTAREGEENVGTYPNPLAL